MTMSYIESIYRFLCLSSYTYCILIYTLQSSSRMHFTIFI